MKVSKKQFEDALKVARAYPKTMHGTIATIVNFAKQREHEVHELKEQLHKLTQGELFAEDAEERRKALMPRLPPPVQPDEHVSAKERFLAAWRAQDMKLVQSMSRLLGDAKCNGWLAEFEAVELAKKSFE